MANIKSAKKRILVNQTRYERNKGVKSAVKTAIKKVEAAVAANDKAAADEALPDILPWNRGVFGRAGTGADSVYGRAHEKQTRGGASDVYLPSLSRQLRAVISAGVQEDAD